MFLGHSMEHFEQLGWSERESQMVPKGQEKPSENRDELFSERCGLPLMQEQFFGQKFGLAQVLLVDLALGCLQ